LLCQVVVLGPYGVGASLCTHVRALARMHARTDDENYVTWFT